MLLTHHITRPQELKSNPPDDECQGDLSYLYLTIRGLFVGEQRQLLSNIQLTLLNISLYRFGDEVVNGQALGNPVSNL